MDTTEAIHRWRSIRRYREEAVPDEALRRILEAARRAPSWENVQPWHFIAIRDAAMKEKLAALARGQKHVARAPLVIAVCGDLGAWSKERNREVLIELLQHAGVKAPADLVEKQYLNDPVACVAGRGPSIVLARTFEQVGIAYAFMALEAVNQGLGVCMVGAFGNEVTGGDKGLYDEIRGLLRLPDDYCLLALLTIGRPAEDPPARPRKPLEKIVSRETYGNPL